MNKLILLGGGGHCESVIEIINSLRTFEIVGVLDPDFDNGLKTVLNVPVLGCDFEIPKFIGKGCQFVITVGQIKSAKIRQKLYSEVKRHGGALPTIIAKTAYVSETAKLGEGTVVMNQVVVNVGVNTGICCIINTSSILEHGCIVGDFSHISTRAVLNGNTTCGNNCFVGSGTIINQNVEIGDNTIIASGSLVRKNIKNNSLVAGNPLKYLR